MNNRRAAAVELLLSHPDSTVAEMLGVRLVTLRRWMREREFCSDLKAREREQAASLSRISRQAALNAASALCSAIADPSKPDNKLLIDILKQSGAFEAEPGDPGDALAEAIRAAASSGGANDNS